MRNYLLVDYSPYRVDAVSEEKVLVCYNSDMEEVNMEYIYVSGKNYFTAIFVFPGTNIVYMYSQGVFFPIKIIKGSKYNLKEIAEELVRENEYESAG